MRQIVHPICVARAERPVRPLMNITSLSNNLLLWTICQYFKRRGVVEDFGRIFCIHFQHVNNQRFIYSKLKVVKSEQPISPFSRDEWLKTLDGSSAFFSNRRTIKEFFVK